MAFYQKTIENRQYALSDKLTLPGIIHGFTSAQGGCSHGQITGLNLGFRVQDDPEDVMQNYRLVSGDFGFPLERTVLAKQTHTANIRHVTEEDCGKGLTRRSDIEDTDGLITALRNITLVVFSADCIPILLSDPVRHVAAAVHSGWRGTVQNIGGKAARMMTEEFGCAPRNIQAAIGPSIDRCCFEIGEDITGQFDPAFVRADGSGKYHVALKQMAARQLMLAGIPAENIDISDECTMCSGGKYYSYRAQKEHTGRQAAFICQK